MLWLALLDIMPCWLLLRCWAHLRGCADSCLHEAAAGLVLQSNPTCCHCNQPRSAAMQLACSIAW